MDKAELLAIGLEQIISSLNDKEYAHLDIEDIVHDEDLNEALDRVYKRFHHEDLISAYEGNLYIDHLWTLNENYYVIFDGANDLIIILKDNSREFEKLVFKYQDEFIDTIKQYLGVNDNFTLSDDSDGVALYFPSDMIYQIIEEDAEDKEGSIMVHGFHYNIKYKMKEVNGKKYAFVLIEHDVFNSLFSMFLVKENYKERFH